MSILILAFFGIIGLTFVFLVIAFLNGRFYNRSIDKMKDIAIVKRRICRNHLDTSGYGNHRCSYGYGCFQRNENSGTHLRKLKIYFRDPNAPTVYEEHIVPPAFTPIEVECRVKTGINRGKLYKEAAPLFVVSDGENWYEYLTGLRIDTFDSSMGGSSIIWSNDFVSENFAAFDIDRHGDCDEQYFARELSKFTNRQLKYIAKEIRKSIKNAEKWRKNYLKLCTKLQLKWKVENDSAVGMIRSKFGKF